jgi:hypothetical protein
LAPRLSWERSNLIRRQNATLDTSCPRSTAPANRPRRSRASGAVFGKTFVDK